MGFMFRVPPPSLSAGFGYFGTGWTGSVSTTSVDKLNFANDSISAAAATMLGKTDAIGFNSPTNGYVAGGRDNKASASVNSIERLTFATDTSALLSAILGATMRSAAGLNSTVRGYVAGGFQSSNSKVIQRLIFADETCTVIAATLQVERMTSASGINSSTKGYAVGGENAAGFKTTEIDGIQFDTEAVANPAATLATATSFMAGVNSTLAGYECGGSATTNQIVKFLFSTETRSTLSAILATARSRAVGVNSATQGYVAGGYTTSAVNDIDGLEFAGETAINPSATLASARYDLSGFQSGSL